MRKKLLAIFLVLALAISMTACEEDTTDEDVKAVADQFLTAVQEGDFEAASELCDEDAYKDMGLKSMTKMDKSFAKALGEDMDDLSKDAKKSLKSLTKYFCKEFLNAYEITEVTETTEGYFVRANVTYGFDLKKLSEATITDEESDEITADYLENNKDELLEVYKTDGEDKMRTKIVSDLMPDYVAKYKGKIGKLGTAEGKIQLLLEQQGEKWVITNASTIGEGE